MKKLLSLILLSSVLGASSHSQEIQHSQPDPQVAKHSNYYYQRETHFQQLPLSSKDTVFLGDSISDGAEWGELLTSKHYKNRGISGDTSKGVLDRIGTIIAGKPKAIFLLVGINDLSRGGKIENITKNLTEIAERIKAQSPKTKLYIQSLLPVSDELGFFPKHTIFWQQIPAFNMQFKQVAERTGAVYIDLYSEFVDPKTQKLSLQYTNDGLHLVAKGYQHWLDVIKPYLR